MLSDSGDHTGSRALYDDCAAMTIQIPPSGTRGTRLRGLPILRAFLAIYVRLYRLRGAPLDSRGRLLLTTIGARSGRERTVPLAGFADGERRWLVVGSFAGAARHPAWFINLARNPDKVWVQVGRERFKARPELLDGEERAVAWDRIVTVAPGFAEYERQTDRQLPIVRLIRDEET
jgi:deazaflavin-dependent oxidoreductase (nitroreductase family)